VIERQTIFLRLAKYKNDKFIASINWDKKTNCELEDIILRTI